MRNRLLFLLVLVRAAALGGGQVVLDGHFIAERWLVNAAVDPVSIDDMGMVMDHCEPVRDYALDEPYQWVKRVYHRIEPSENPDLASIGAGDVNSSLAQVIDAAIDSGGAYVHRHGLCTTIGRGRKHMGPGPITIKVDFAYNDTLGKLEQHIIGFGIVQVDGRQAYMYFPELRWMLKRYDVKTASGSIPLSRYFDEWMFVSHALEPPSDNGRRPRWFGGAFYEQQSEFDALTTLYILEHEITSRGVILRGKRSLRLTGYMPDSRAAIVHFTPAGAVERIEVKKGKITLLTANYLDGEPHGPFREFHPKGGLAQQGQFDHGLRTGAWVSWFENANIKSRRIYVDGRLHGQQRVYHDNGDLLLEYDMVNGEYEGKHRAFYRDGRMKSEGEMKGGFVSGEWKYSILISDTLKSFLNTHPELVAFPPSAWEDNYLDYRVTYAQTGKDDWTCVLRKCIEVIRPKQVW
ncbi:MAG: toxin-antitoxin system YwqK family antitoxin [Flavobacteriales bacterium]|nr:toxin-antitoxin system YwqK family antitoxin [Flavobacteriales bacterium]